MIRLMFAVLFGVLFGVGCDSRPALETSGNRSIAVTALTEAPFTTQLIKGLPWAIPQGMDLDRYPIRDRGPNRKLTNAEARYLGLHLDTVPAGTVLWNEDPRHQAFWLDVMNTERKVWKNEMDEVVYIEDCGNRAMAPVANQICPGSVVCAGPHVGPAVNGGLGPDQTNGRVNAGASQLAPGASNSGDNGGRGWMNSLWDFLKDLIWLLLMLLLLAAVLGFGFLLLRELWGFILNPRQGTTAPQPAVPAAPAPAPAPRVVPAPVPAPQPVPAAARQNREVPHGPFDHIEIQDAQANGVQVTVEENGQERVIGPFRTARTVNAGDRGEYLMVTT